MKGKIFSKRKATIITLCLAVVLSIGATTAFAAAQNALMVKDGKVHAGALKVKEGLPAGQQFIEGEELAAKNLEDTGGKSITPVRTKDSQVPAGALKVKEGLTAGQQGIK